MATKKISELPSSAAVGSSAVPVSSADGTTTSKVTLQEIADLAVPGGNAVVSNTEGIAGANKITNLVSLTQAEYDAITPDETTLYIVIN